jgi:hypothetical protein
VSENFLHSPGRLSQESPGSGGDRSSTLAQTRPTKQRLRRVESTSRASKTGTPKSLTPQMTRGSIPSIKRSTSLSLHQTPLHTLVVHETVKTLEVLIFKKAGNGHTRHSSDEQHG